MKVYLLWEEPNLEAYPDCYCNVLYGVYSSREEAENAQVFPIRQYLPEEWNYVIQEQELNEIVLPLGE